MLDAAVPLYAADCDSCRPLLRHARRGPAPPFLTWRVCSEFLRGSTRPRGSRSPWTINGAARILLTLMGLRGFRVLVAIPRRAGVLTRTLLGLSGVPSSALRDLHAAVLIRDHGIGRACSRDDVSRHFTFPMAVDPLRVSGSYR